MDISGLSSEAAVPATGFAVSSVDTELEPEPDDSYGIQVDGSMRLTPTHAQQARRQDPSDDTSSYPTLQRLFTTEYSALHKGLQAYKKSRQTQRVFACHFAEGFSGEFTGLWCLRYGLPVDGKAVNDATGVIRNWLEDHLARLTSLFWIRLKNVFRAQIQIANLHKACKAYREAALQRLLEWWIEQEQSKIRRLADEQDRRAFGTTSSTSEKFRISDHVNVVPGWIKEIVVRNLYWKCRHDYCEKYYSILRKITAVQTEILFHRHKAVRLKKEGTTYSIITEVRNLTQHISKNAEEIGLLREQLPVFVFDSTTVDMKDLARMTNQLNYSEAFGKVEHKVVHMTMNPAHAMNHEHHTRIHIQHESAPKPHHHHPASSREHREASGSVSTHGHHQSKSPARLSLRAPSPLNVDGIGADHKSSARSSGRSSGRSSSGRVSPSTGRSDLDGQLPSLQKGLGLGRSGDYSVPSARLGVVSSRGGPPSPAHSNRSPSVQGMRSPSPSPRPLESLAPLPQGGRRSPSPSVKLAQYGHLPPPSPSSRGNLPPMSIKLV